jgi:hypothetical protein
MRDNGLPAPRNGDLKLDRRDSFYASINKQ